MVMDWGGHVLVNVKWWWRSCSDEGHMVVNVKWCWRSCSDEDHTVVNVKWWWRSCSDEGHTVVNVKWWWRSCSDEGHMVVNVKWWWRSCSDEGHMVVNVKWWHSYGAGLAKVTLLCAEGDVVMTRSRKDQHPFTIRIGQQFTNRTANKLKAFNRTPSLYYFISNQHKSIYNNIV
jgi:hypothetical protein